MVDNCFSAASFCLCAAVLAVLLRQYNREQAMFAAVAACTAVVGGALLMAGPILTEISDIFTAAGISDDYISLVFKAVAVCFITQITADICRDSGETAIASAAELWGRAALVFMSLPVMRVLMEIINEMI